MKESQFIEQNKEKWLESEKLLASGEKDTNKLSSLFVQITDDLSYARTFFSHRFIKVYLNKTAMKFFSQIYVRKKSKWAHFTEFWKEELPQVVIHCRKELIISVLAFLLAVLVGVVSSINDPDFVASILGDSYVAMTKENINSGDPMKVYKESNQSDMFLSITTNNIRVSFLTYLSGLIAGIGTLMLLLYNGIMLGSFQYFFFQHGLLGESMLAVWLHGTLEISSIIIAGGAGLVLGRGILLPGTLSRTQAFYISATRSLKLLLGTVPLFIVAGFVESFLTRYTEVPWFVRLAFILVSLFFIIGYFGVYPYMKSKTGFKVPLQRIKLAPTIKEQISFNSIKNNSEIIKDTFYLYFKNTGSIFTVTILSCMTLLIFNRVLLDHTETLYWNTSWVVALIKDVFELFEYKNYSYALVCGVVSGIALFFVNHIIYRIASGKAPVNTLYYVTGLTNALIICIALHYLLYSISVAGVVFISLFVPFLLLLVYIAHAEHKFFILSIGSLFKILGAGLGQSLLLCLIIIITSFTFSVILNSPLLYMSIEWVKANIDPSLSGLNTGVSAITFIISGLVLLSVLAFNIFSIAMLYYSNKEIVEAEGLRAKINQLSKVKTKYAV